MLKMMILAPRRVGMTHAEFRAYVIGVHGPLVRSVAEVAADIRHYHYNFPIFGVNDAAFGHPLAAHLDILTEGWFDSRAAHKRNMAHPRYMEIVRPDEGKFADEKNAIMHYMHEVEITPGLATNIKIFYFRRRRPNLSRAEFQTLWRAGVTEAVGESAVWPSIASRYIQNHALSEADTPHGTAEKFFDVVDEIFLHEPNGIAGLTQDGAAMAALRGLEQQLTETTRTLALVTEMVPNIA